LSSTHVLAMIVEDKPGVMTRIADMFRRKLVNIDTITVGKTRVPGLSRIVITLECDEDFARYVVKLLRKTVDVLYVEELQPSKSILRELALVKVEVDETQEKLELLQLVNIFRGGIVDVSESTITAQVVGDPSKVDAFIKLCRRFKIIELARTGIVAMSRGPETLLPDELAEKFMKEGP